jgi:hypothetical protein
MLRIVEILGFLVSILSTKAMRSCHIQTNKHRLPPAYSDRNVVEEVLLQMPSRVFRLGCSQRSQGSQEATEAREAQEAGEAGEAKGGRLLQNL